MTLLQQSITSLNKSFIKKCVSTTSVATGDPGCSLVPISLEYVSHTLNIILKREEEDPSQNLVHLLEDIEASIVDLHMKALSTRARHDLLFSQRNKAVGGGSFPPKPPNHLDSMMQPPTISRSQASQFQPPLRFSAFNSQPTTAPVSSNKPFSFSTTTRTEPSNMIKLPPTMSSFPKLDAPPTSSAFSSKSEPSTSFFNFKPAGPPPPTTTTSSISSGASIFKSDPPPTSSKPDLSTTSFFMQPPISSSTPKPPQLNQEPPKFSFNPPPLGTTNMFSNPSATSVTPTTNTGTNEENEDDEDSAPPVNEFKPVEETDVIYETRVKIFEKGEKDYKELGLGRLYVKDHPKGHHLFVRAENNLGTLLVNMILTDKIPLIKKPKSIMTVDPLGNSGKGTTYLIRVKNDEAATELKNKLEELKMMKRDNNNSKTATC